MAQIKQGLQREVNLAKARLLRSVYTTNRSLYFIPSTMEKESAKERYYLIYILKVSSFGIE